MSDIRLNKEDGMFVQQQLKAGTYDSAEEMIAAGLNMLRAQEADTLRMLIQEGIDDIDTGRYHTYDSAEDMLADISSPESDH